jgi:hypothetical protein
LTGDTNGFAVGDMRNNNLGVFVVAEEPSDRLTHKALGWFSAFEGLPVWGAAIRVCPLHENESHSKPSN